MSGIQLALIDMTPNEVVTRSLSLPFTPPSKNRYDNWQPAWKSGARKKWYKHIDAQIAERQFPKARAVTVEATLVFGSNRRRDWQNYVHPLMYWIADSLVYNDILEDDTPDMFKVGTNGGIRFALDRRKIDPKLRQRTEIVYSFELWD